MVHPSQPHSKQGLYAGRIGSFSQELATPLTPTEQTHDPMPATSHAEGVLILLPVDYRHRMKAQKSSSATRSKRGGRPETIAVAGNPTSVGPAPSGTFLVSTSVMDFPAAAVGRATADASPVPSNISPIRNLFWRDRRMEHPGSSVLERHSGRA